MSCFFIWVFFKLLFCLLIFGGFSTVKPNPPSRFWSGAAFPPLLVWRGGTVSLSSRLGASAFILPSCGWCCFFSLLLAVPITKRKAKPDHEKQGQPRPKEVKPTPTPTKDNKPQTTSFFAVVLPFLSSFGWCCFPPTFSGGRGCCSFLFLWGAVVPPPPLSGGDVIPPRSLGSGAVCSPPPLGWCCSLPPPLS